MDGRNLEWFDSKGITPETVDVFGIKEDDEGGIMFPYDGYYKTRFNKDDGSRSFDFPKGSKPQLFVAPIANLSTTVFFCEGETDTMRLWQEFAGQHPVYGIPGINTWRPEWAELVPEQVEHVYVILDNDEDYKVQTQVDKLWRSIRKDLGKKAKRINLPSDVKDVCDFFDKYDLDALRLLAEYRSPHGRFEPLDLTKEPPPVRWMVDGLFCRNDVHLLIGEPNIGKSWLTMSLAVAIADNHPTFLGRTIREHGRVLYVDEENAADLVYDRFRKLGLTKEGARNIRYFSNLNLRLDKADGEGLLDEAFEWEPTLVVLDALARFHTDDENHSGSMAALFYNAIKPLARETGAAVVLIHHVSKTDSNSSYKRSRGSGDIVASPDAGYDLRQAGLDSLIMAPFKSRRGRLGDEIYIAITDAPDGRVVLEDKPVVPF